MTCEEAHELVKILVLRRCDTKVRRLVGCSRVLPYTLFHTADASMWLAFHDSFSGATGVVQNEVWLLFTGTAQVVRTVADSLWDGETKE